jgi:hypothetical protein
MVAASIPFLCDTSDVILRRATAWPEPVFHIFPRGRDALDTAPPSQLQRETFELLSKLGNSSFLRKRELHKPNDFAHALLSEKIKKAISNYMMDNIYQKYMLLRRSRPGLRLPPSALKSCFLKNGPEEKFVFEKWVILRCEPRNRRRK